MASGMVMIIPILPVRNLAISKNALYLITVKKLISFFIDRINTGMQEAMFVKNTTLIMVPVISSATWRQECRSAFLEMCGSFRISSAEQAVMVTAISMITPSPPIKISERKSRLASLRV